MRMYLFLLDGSKDSKESKTRHEHSVHVSECACYAPCDFMGDSPGIAQKGVQALPEAAKSIPPAVLHGVPLTGWRLLL